MRLFLVLPLLFMTTSVFAEQIQFELGVSSYSHDYEEPGLMKESGTLTGIDASIIYRDGIFAQLSVENGKGNVTYDGTGTTTDVPDNLYEYRALIGKDLLAGQWRVTPYLGYGRRYLNDNSQSMISDESGIGYERQSEYSYVPIGISMRYQVAGWALTPTVEYDYFLEGTQTSYLGYLDPILTGTYQDVTNKQNEGMGYRLSVKLTKYLPNNMAFGVEMFYRYWDIGDSVVFIDSDLNGWMEPANTTEQLGIRASMQF